MFKIITVFIFVLLLWIISGLITEILMDKGKIYHQDFLFFGPLSLISKKFRKKRICQKCFR